MPLSCHMPHARIQPLHTSDAEHPRRPCRPHPRPCLLRRRRRRRRRSPGRTWRTTASRSTINLPWGGCSTARASGAPPHHRATRGAFHPAHAGPRSTRSQLRVRFIRMFEQPRHHPRGRHGGERGLFRVFRRSRAAPRRRSHALARAPPRASSLSSLLSTDTHGAPASSCGENRPGSDAVPPQFFLRCVSSWNDNGKASFVHDASRLYRSDFFPARFQSGRCCLSPHDAACSFRGPLQAPRR